MTSNTITSMKNTDTHPPTTPPYRTPGLRPLCAIMILEIAMGTFAIIASRLIATGYMRPRDPDERSWYDYDKNREVTLGMLIYGGILIGTVFLASSVFFYENYIYSLSYRQQHGIQRKLIYSTCTILFAFRAVVTGLYMYTMWSRSIKYGFAYYMCWAVYGANILTGYMTLIFLICIMPRALDSTDEDTRMEAKIRQAIKEHRNQPVPINSMA